MFLKCDRYISLSSILSAFTVKFAYKLSLLYYVYITDQAASWRKRLGARLPPRWGPEFASRSLHVGFVVDETGSGQGFHGVSPVFPYHQFHSTIYPHSSHPFRFISTALVMVRQAWSAGTLATHVPIMLGFIASHPSTRPCVGHELKMFIYNGSMTSTYLQVLLNECVCVCSNANPLHYYVLRVPRKADRWR